MLHGFGIILEGVSPNVTSFFATYFWKNFLQMFILVCFPSFSAKPRRHEFYCRNLMILVYAPFSENSISMRSNSKNYRNASVFSHHLFSMFMTFSASILASIFDGRLLHKWTVSVRTCLPFLQPSSV